MQNQGRQNLSLRASQIASKLLAVKRSMRIKDLSAEFDVSSRTIKYDLESVREYFRGHDVLLESSPSKGIWVSIGEDQRQAMLARLSNMYKQNLYSSQEERVKRVLFHLFFNNHYVTANELADTLDISRNTVLGDMDYIEVLLQGSGIALVRKQRTGYSISGTEAAKRAFFEELVNKSMSVHDILLITERIKNGAAKPLDECPFDETISENYGSIEGILINAFIGHKERMQRENLPLMIIRLLISLKRLENGVFIGSNAELGGTASYYLYPYWADIYSQAGFALYKDEVSYIEGRYLMNEVKTDVAELTADLIKQVGEDMRVPYQKDGTLYARLFAHLSLCLTDEKSNLTENPFNTVIQKNHQLLTASIKRVCRQHLGDSLLINNDSFISYVALHFMVSNRNLAQETKFRAIFVCATGHGAAILIEEMIAGEIKEIEIVTHCSLMEVDNIVRQEQPDYIISVFPIKSEVPVIVVEPLPTRENIDFIRRIIKERSDEVSLSADPLLDFKVAEEDAETISRDIIINGLNIYQQLINKAGFRVIDGLEFAFISHVMLLANRYYFNRQYRGKASTGKAEFAMVAQALAEENITLSDGEIEALLNYLKTGG